MSAATLQLIQLAGPWFLLGVLAAGVSLAALLWPWVTVGLLVLLLFIMLAAKVLSGLRLWQQITLIALMGYVVLGYGFANLTLPLMSVPVGHLMVFVGLLLALPGRGADVRRFFQEPVVWCWLGLLTLTLMHLIDQVPRYGLLAIRDSSLVIEGVFLLSGFLWARRRVGLPPLLRGLALIFLLNLCYSFTFPAAAESLAAVSPRSGIFIDVPLLGTYWHNAVFLVAGALFVYLLGGQALRWSPVIVGGLALLQLFWSLVFQLRSTYMGTVAGLIILALTGERRRAAKAIGGIAVSILLIGALGSLGVRLEGRLGSFTLEFFLEHMRSFVLSGDTPGVGTAQWRADLMPGLVDRWTASAATTVIGEGYGQALIDFEAERGIQVRQPHNTHITIVMRLGLVGLLFWVVMHVRIVFLLVRGVRAAHPSTVARGFAIWMLAFYVMAMIFTSVQPWLEFSMGAIPFYILIGFAAGLAHPNGDA